MTVSKVILSFIAWVSAFEKHVRPGMSDVSLLLLQQQGSRGRVCLNMPTMRILIGNIMSELWTPIMNCCQVNSKWPVKSRKMGKAFCLSPTINSNLIVFIKQSSRTALQNLLSSLDWMLINGSKVNITPLLFVSKNKMLYLGPYSVQKGHWVCHKTWCWSTWYTAIMRNSRKPSEHEWKCCLADGWSQNTKDVHRWNLLTPSWRINCWDITEHREKPENWKYSLKRFY